MKLKDCIGKKIYRTKPVALPKEGSGTSWSSPESWLIPMRVLATHDILIRDRVDEGNDNYEGYRLGSLWDDGNWALVGTEEEMPNLDLTSKSTEKWLEEDCNHGDELRLIKIRDGKDFCHALHNRRTKVNHLVALGGEL